MPEIVYHLSNVDFDRPGKHHYQLAFHLDGNWGYSIVPLTVINGLRGPQLSESAGTANARTYKLDR